MLIILLLGIPLTASAFSFFAWRIASLRVIACTAAALMSVTVLALLVVAAQGTYGVAPLFTIDSMGSLFTLVVGIVGAAALWHSTGYLEAEMEKGILGFRRVRQYFILLDLFLCAMLFATATSNPILMWVAIEGTTLATAFLISLYNQPSALEAAWKYLILNSVGLLLAFFGTLIFSYQAIRLSNAGFVDWQGLLSTASILDPLLVKLAFIFIVIGYGTKIGLAPMHTWLPDAHSKAPAPVSALLSGVLLNVAFLGLIRFKSVADTAIGSEFSTSLLIVFGVVSMIIAALLIFGQKNYKRLLAYSSIEHMGIVTLGFGFGGAGAAAALLHMLYHALAKSLLFLSAGTIFLRYSSTRIAQVRGMVRTLPATAALFVIGSLAITGVPPFGTFLTEFNILAAGMSAHPVVALCALAAIVFVFVGFLRHMTAMLFGAPLIMPEQAFLWHEHTAAIAPIAALALLLAVLSVFLPATVQTVITAATAAY